MLTLDDVALRGRSLGDLLDLVERRRPIGQARHRILLLDEIQHSPEWSGWLKRLADRREPYLFLATGSSASALRRGGQDQGVGRWDEMVLFPWSFREHVHFRGTESWTFRAWDDFHARLDTGLSVDQAWSEVDVEAGERPPEDHAILEEALVDYLTRGGFPEVIAAANLREAQRRLRQDILDRALGRDILDVTDADPVALERMFLRICRNPGGLWNATEVASDLGISRPTVNRYLRLLTQSFLVFSLPNLASPIKGQPKVYLVAPSLRSALLRLDERDVAAPAEWGRLVENLVASNLKGTRPDAVGVGFWRRDRHEVDVVVEAADDTEYIEVKRSGKRALRALQAAARALKRPGTGYVLQRELNPFWSQRVVDASLPPIDGVWHMPAVEWLYSERGAAGGTLLKVR